MLGGSITTFPLCPACGRENRVQGATDYNCAWCHAVVAWTSRTEEDGRVVGEWTIKLAPNEGVVDALNRGEDPWARVPVQVKPYAERQAAALERIEVNTGLRGAMKVHELAKELGVKTWDLVAYARTMGIFAEKKGGPLKVLTLQQAVRLRDMYKAGLGRMDTTIARETAEELTEEELVAAEG